MTTTDTRQATTDPAAAAVSLITDGTPARTVAAETGLSVGEVIAAAEAAGISRTRTPDLTALGKELAQALMWGSRHDNKKIVALADRARTALNDLSAARRNESVVAEAEAEISALRKKLTAAEAQAGITALRETLAAAEDKLRSTRGRTARGAAGTGKKTAAPMSTLTKAERDEIRRWARANGHGVGAYGVIPTPVIEAWRDARKGA